MFRGGADQVAAVIGGLSSAVTIQVRLHCRFIFCCRASGCDVTHLSLTRVTRRPQLATLMHMFKVPQVSYMSTSPALSDRMTYPYFFRTVPSDLHQAHAMLELLRSVYLRAPIPP